MRHLDERSALPPEETWPVRQYSADAPHPSSINLAVELVDVHVSAGRGDALAIVASDGRLTYRALQNQINCAARVLTNAGVSPGDRVVLRLHNSAALVVLWLAVQRIGAIAVATPAALRAREIATIVKDTEPAAVIAGPGLAGEITAVATWSAPAPAVLVLDPDVPATLTSALAFGPLLAALPPVVEIEAVMRPRDAVASIIYTASLSIDPKGACHSAADMLASADAYARQVLGTSSTDVVGGTVPVALAYGLGALLVFPLRCGATTTLIAGFTAEALLAAIERERVTLLFSTPTAYRLMLRLPDLERRVDFGSLRLAVSAGEPLDPSIAEAWRRRTGVEMIDSLGTTELFHVFVSQEPGHVATGTIGRVIPGYDVRVLDEHFGRAPVGVPGRLAVRGPTGCRYWRRLDAQRAYVQHGWNLTGDRAVQNERGEFRLLGRDDDLIISAGYNISGPEVEAVIREHVSVADVAVVAAPDPTRGCVPAAFVVLRSDTRRDGMETTLIEHLRNALAAYKCPRRFEFLDALPRVPDGGPDRAVLRALAGGRPPGSPLTA
jgi:2-aminobenzoate-CoA ligase